MSILRNYHKNKGQKGKINWLSLAGGLGVSQTVNLNNRVFVNQIFGDIV